MNLGDRVLGIDPGLNTTGYAVLEARGERPFLCEAGIIQPSPGRKPTEMAQRLKSLYTSLVEVLELYHPKLMVVEQLYAHYQHPRTAILMAHARGVILLAAGVKDIPVMSLTVTEIKSRITGSGRASKEQMQHAMLRELNLPTLPEPHDVADALAIALCGYQLRSSPATPTQSLGA